MLQRLRFYDSMGICNNCVSKNEYDFDPTLKYYHLLLIKFNFVCIMIFYFDSYKISREEELKILYYRGFVA